MLAVIEHTFLSALADAPGVAAELGGGDAELSFTDSREELTLTGLISVKCASVQGLEAEVLSREVERRELSTSVTENAPENGFTGSKSRGW